MANTHSTTLVAASSQHFSITDAAQTGLDLASVLSFEAWIKISNLPGSGSYYSILSKRRGSTNNRSYDFYLYNNAGTYQLGLVGSGAGTNVDINGAVTWSSPSTAIWYHVACTWSHASSTITMYVNGSSIGTSDTTGWGFTSLYNGAAAFNIGASEEGNAAFFDGQIDDVRVWNVLRSGTEINNNKCTEIDSDANLKGSWHLNESSGDATDSSGNGNTLVNTNSATFSTDYPSCFNAAINSGFFCFM